MTVSPDRNSADTPGGNDELKNIIDAAGGTVPGAG